MRKILTACAALAVALPLSTASHAGDAAFLMDMAGNWSGGGPVRMTPASSPVNVSCQLAGQADASSVSLDGACTGLVLFSRRIGAALELRNGSFSGTYVGSERGTASLHGHREGQTLDMALQWPDHPPAIMRLSQPAEGRMILTTIEQNPQTGEQVVTAELELQRQ
jgi:hypothetical protein